MSFLPVPAGRKPLALPDIIGPDGERLSRYEKEKRLGIRRDNGARKLKRLTRRHMDIITMHISGYSGTAIAALMSIRQSTVSLVLNDPLAQEIISAAYKDRESELTALTGRVVDTIRDGLDKNKDMRTRLAAVDKFAKVKAAIINKDETEDTAEDVAKRVLERANFLMVQNLQINNDGPRPAGTGSREE